MAIECKINDNRILETTCAEGLNKSHDPENAIMVYSLKHNEPIPIILRIAFIIMDQIEHMPATNHSGDNSDWGPRRGWSCNFKDLQFELPSCETCYYKLMIVIDNKNAKNA